METPETLEETKVKVTKLSSQYPHLHSNQSESSKFKKQRVSYKYPADQMPLYSIRNIPKFGYGEASVTRMFHARQLGQYNNHYDRDLQGHGSLLRRLKCESELNGHAGCVNTLSWNDKGTLLASGSDDLKLVVWDYATKKQRHSIQTGHCRNIFGVCFLPHTNDQVLASGGMDREVRIHYPPYLTGSSKLFRVHKGRVKDVRACPQAPYMFWTSGEDGVVYQFDIRDLPNVNPETGECSITEIDDPILFTSSGALIRLGKKDSGQRIRAMGSSIHPLDPMKMALACGDQYIRLYDRRMLRYSLAGEETIPLAMFAPAHLHFQPRSTRGYIQHGTSVQFNCDGSEILVSYHNDHIYLYSTHEVNQERTQDLDVNPIQTYNHQVHLRKHNRLVDPNTFKELGNEAYKKDELTKAINYYTAGIEISEAINSNSDLLMKLYANRAHVFILRKWKGDSFQAIEDCHRALRIDPLNRKALYRLVRATKEFGDGAKTRERAQHYRDAHPEHASDMSCLLKTRSRSHQFDGEDIGSSSEEVDESEEDEEEEDHRYDEHIRRYEDRIHTSVLRRYIGYCNIQTDIKEAKFFGANDLHIVSGSDDGRVFVWEKSTGKLINAFDADEDIVNCVQCHPFDACLASSGIENIIRLWTPLNVLEPEDEDAEDGKAPRRYYSHDDITLPTEDELATYVNSNQGRMNDDTLNLVRPFDSNLMQLLLQRYQEGDEMPQDCSQS